MSSLVIVSGPRGSSCPSPCTRSPARVPVASCTSLDNWAIGIRGLAMCRTFLTICSAREPRSLDGCGRMMVMMMSSESPFLT